MAKTENRSSEYNTTSRRLLAFLRLYYRSPDKSSQDMRLDYHRKNPCTTTTRHSGRLEHRPLITFCTPPRHGAQSRIWHEIRIMGGQPAYLKKFPVSRYDGKLSYRLIHKFMRRVCVLHLPKASSGPRPDTIHLIRYLVLKS